MHIIKSVGVLSCAKIFGAIQAAIGLIVMPFFLLFAMVGMITAPKGPNGISAAVMVVFALLLPVFYGVLGFIMGALGGWVYNLVSNWTGGIELELQPPAAAAVAASTYPGIS